MTISVVECADLPHLVPMINAAYRGDASREGWTTEADIVGGEKRTDLHQLQALWHQPGVALLKATNCDGSICGSVLLRHESDKRLYLGMLSVWPHLQDAGIGRRLMEAAEHHARALGCHQIYMQVIDCRSELLAWYERRGYSLTGERKDFVVDAIFAKALQPLAFVFLAKSILPEPQQLHG